MNRQEIEAWLMARSLRRHAAAHAEPVREAPATRPANAGPLFDADGEEADGEETNGEEANGAEANGAEANGAEANGAAFFEESGEADGDDAMLERLPAGEADSPGGPVAEEMHMRAGPAVEIWDGRPRQSRRKAAGIDIRTARCARWSDMLGLLYGRPPDYLIPLLTYALGMKHGPYAARTVGEEGSGSGSDAGS
jgi:hypothetical protein